ncbi:MAG: glycosyltransferase [Bacteroidota bacterium]
MRLHFYLEHFPPSGSPLVGGTAKAVHGLASALADEGNEIVVLAEHERRQTAHHAGYRVESFPRDRWGRQPEMRTYLAEQPAEGLLVLNGMFSPRLGTLARWCRRMGRPYVVAPHTPYAPHVFRRGWLKKRAFWHLAERPTLQGATAIQVLAPLQGEYLETLGITTPRIEVPNGFRAADVCPAQSLPDREPSLFFFGRIDAFTKGLDVLVEACERVPQVSLTLQGPDWGDADALRKQGMALPGRFQVLDPVYDQPAAQVMSGYHVFCCPSRYEGFGLSVLEAMIAERPVLVSDQAGIAPHVRQANCGVVVSPDVDSIVAGLKTLLARQAEWAAMGERGRTYAERNLNWPAIAREAQAAYARVLGISANEAAASP